jgi:exodeoxyribonuclease V beta subunit
LSEYVLESDHFFDVELISDSSEYLLEIVRDYWRKRLYPPRIRYVPIITAVFASPQALYDSIAGAENRLDILIPEPWPFADAVTVLESSWDKLKTWWSSHGATLASRYSDLIEQGYCKVAAEREFAGRLEYCETAFTGDHLCEASRLSWLDGDSIIDAINANKVGGSSKKARVIESWVLPENLLTDYADACEKLILCMRLECADTVRRNLIPRLQAAGVLDFDGLITLFVEALASSSGARLTRLVGKRYKMALIDEFQDTDQSQWFIFSRLFSSPGNRLYLIGDPKQAIYRFRGADIEAYFQAKKSARSRSTLSANYRSHPALINAVNRLFNAACIGGETFMPVTAALSGSDGCLRAGDVDCSGIVYCQLAERRDKDSTWSKGAADELVVSSISHEIARLIDVRGDMAVDEAQDGNRRPVRPGDIAILVRTNDQAERYMAALRKATIPAIVTSKISVFASGECEALRAVAMAVLHPDEPLLVRSALALDWFGLSGDEHYRICSDSVRFGEIQRRFSGGRKRWLAAGFYAMLTGLISDEQIYEHLCKKPSVERRIANIEHLAQLIQQAETENHLTPLQTMQWLSNAAGRQAMAQETELHLESDREAVQILTLHSAKGLEFPIVFCPHLMHASSPAKKIRVRCVFILRTAPPATILALMILPCAARRKSTSRVRRTCGWPMSGLPGPGYAAIFSGPISKDVEPPPHPLIHHLAGCFLPKGPSHSVRSVTSWLNRPVQRGHSTGVSIQMRFLPTSRRRLPKVIRYCTGGSQGRVVWLPIERAPALPAWYGTRRHMELMNLALLMKRSPHQNRWSLVGCRLVSGSATSFMRCSRKVISLIWRQVRSTRTC